MSFKAGDRVRDLRNGKGGFNGVVAGPDGRGYWVVFDRLDSYSDYVYPEQIALLPPAPAGDVREEIAKSIRTTRYAISDEASLEIADALLSRFDIKPRQGGEVKSLKELMAQVREEMGEDTFKRFCDDLAGKRYKCPVCDRDELAYLTCLHAGCPDGRDQGR